jgi:hypothetical protein
VRTTAAGLFHLNFLALKFSFVRLSYSLVRITAQFEGHEAETSRFFGVWVSHYADVGNTTELFEG